MKIFLSTGEPSGDHHAAHLVRALAQRCEGAEFVGFGGPQLEAAGCRLLYPLTDLAVMWFLQVGLNLHRFLALASEADRYFRHQRPDAVVLVDYPGFNWWIARRAKFHGIPVFYYVPPQLWGWASWRVKKMRRFVDHVLCSLPFEPAWYAERGVHAVYVGHPFFEESETGDSPKLPISRPSRNENESAPLVGLLPGSRTQEVRKNFAIMLRAAARLAQRLPAVRFEVACFSPEHRKIAGQIHAELAAHNARLRDLDLAYCVRETPRIIRQADVCLSVSGSVSLELLDAETPTVILYKIGRIDLKVCNRFMHARYITLVNLLADDEVFPEFLTDHDCSPKLADILFDWLSRPEEAERVRSQLRTLKTTACLPGASERAADYLLAALAPGHTKPHAPHFAMRQAPSRLIP